VLARTAARPLAFVLAALAAFLGFLASSAPTREEPRTGEAILKEYDGLKPPAFHLDRRDDRAYVESYEAEARKFRARLSGLIDELLKVDPRNERLPKLIVARWGGRDMRDDPDALGKLDKQIAEAVEKTGNVGLRIEGAYVKAGIAARAARAAGDDQAFARAAEAFADVVPKGDERAGGLLYAAYRVVEEPAVRSRLESRIFKDHPDVAARVEAARRRRDAVGKPFDLEFEDAVSGKTIRMADLKGKVVVIDFWATWCGPCIAEMPRMKKLHAEFKDKGVEFIGVSSDAPEEEGKGLTRLKTFVVKHEIGWPQYYQGEGLAFSRGWGVDTIPSVFVVDAEGKIFSTEARGKLETMIPELLAKSGG